MRRTPVLRYRPTWLPWLTAVALLAALAAPAAALADRYGSDSVGGKALSSGEVARTAAPDVQMTAGLLLATDGRELWTRAEDAGRPMASITKVMTGLLALEQGGLDDEVAISKAASQVDDATGLLPGETFTVRELLELALVTSSNDAAYALAEHAGPGVPAFVTQMNAKAAELDLAHTRYVNPHGLDAPGHYSSPADIASLARTAMRSTEFRRIVAMRSVTLPAHGARTAKTIESTDELLGSYQGIQGVKTGFTNDAKHCFVASAQRDGVTLTAVVLGASTNAARFKQCARLLDWGFAHYASRQVTTATETVGVVPLAANSSRTVPVRYAEATSVPVFDLDGAVTSTTTLDASVALPVYAGQPLGEAVISQGTRELARIAVVAATSTASAEETVGAVPVSDYLDRAVTARAGGAGLVVPKFDADAAIDRRVDLDAKVGAPVAAGQKLGEIVYSQHGTVIVRVPVVAAEAVAEPGLATKVVTWLARAWRMVTRQPTMAPRVVL